MKHPQATLILPDPNDPLGDVLQCPECGRQARLEDYDVLGADEGCVFCNWCSSELRMPQ